MKLMMPENVTPATMIAYAGHGGYYDHLARPIQMDDALVLRIETSMTEQLLASGDRRLAGADDELLTAAQRLAQSGELDPARAALLQGAVTSFLLETANEDLRGQFEWRHRLLMRRYTQFYIDADAKVVPAPGFERILERLRRWVLIDVSTDYVKRCRADQVPIPASWSDTNSNGWVYHGDLAENLLQPGVVAQVWTWSDPAVRGGCIMLPRGSGVGGLAGTICQSADTGKACFWDNKHRTTGAVLGWSGVTLDVNRMQDGDMLAENCTGCHRGNNVFLISPDDQTWAHVLRPASGSSIGAAFTTNLATGISRYTPVSNQGGWANQSGSQCIGCHERPMVGFGAVPSSMPPLCANGSLSSPASCYN